ncbi:MAG: hypothetical protein ABFE07_02800 [Armatimonadia bacterium]
MPLKLYFQNAAAPYTPATIRGAWSNTAGANTAALGTSPSGGATAANVPVGYAGQPENVLVTRFSYVLTSDYLFGEAVSGVIGAYESAAGLNGYLKLHIFVTQGESDAPRGTLLANLVDAQELNTDTAACGGAFSGVPAELQCYEGDVLVVEVGYRASSTESTYRGYIYRGGTGSPDLADNGDPSANPGWLSLTHIVPVGADMGALWHVGGPIGTDMQALWHVGGPIGADTELLWRVREFVTLLPETSIEVSTLDVANKVWVVVEGSDPLVYGSATNDEIAPKYSVSPREMLILVKSGDAALCEAVAAAYLALYQTARYKLAALPVPLRYGLGIRRGTKIMVTIPRASISGAFTVRRVEHDFAANISRIDVGEFAAARDDGTALLDIATLLAKLEKELAI